MIRVMLVDDHAIVRQGLRKVLGESPGIRVLAEAASVLEALDISAKMDLDVVILDIGLPGRGGLEALAGLKANKPALHIVIFSMYSEEQYAIRCFRDGASAFVTKESPPSELIHAINTVASGRRYITPSIGERMAGLLLDPDTRVPHERLTDRELQVLLGIGAGLGIIEIAGKLSLSPKTVSTYKARILEKMGMQNTAQLVKYVVEANLSGKP
jgi:DNA-binding NarL/FixJ family response regulator